MDFPFTDNFKQIFTLSREEELKNNFEKIE